MTQPVYTFWIRDNNLNRVERLDTWTAFTIIMRFNKVGTWNLEIPTGSNMARFITQGCGIIVQRDGATIFSGQVDTDYIRTKNTIKMSGTDDNVILEEVARPTPSLSEGPYPDEYYVATGQASSIMIDLVNRNIGGLAPAACKIDDLTIGTDPLLGTTITARARFDPLIILLAELASTPIATGLGFKVLQNDNLAAARTFSIYEPRDKHVETVFSVERHTIQDYTHSHTEPAYNYFIVAGGDDFGVNRTTVEDGDDAAITLAGRRKTLFVDARGVTDLGELNQKLAEQLATVVTSDTIQVIPADVPELVFGDDYDLGDYVTAVIEGTEYAMLVREVQIDFDPNRGPIIIPTIADPNGGTDQVEAQHLNTLENRISNIERNWNVPDDSITEDMLHPFMKWNVGDIKITARDAAQPGWLLCDGSEISRTVYSRLFSEIGILFGPGTGGITFNLPQMQNRFPIGAGDLYAVGDGGGAAAYNIVSHVHAHSHGLNGHTHASQAHTHPGSHSHGLNGHNHLVTVDMGTGSATGTPNTIHSGGGSGTDVNPTNHGHSGTPTATGGPSPSTTESDSNAPAATYTGDPSGPSPSSTESDTGAGPSTASQNVLNPYLALNYEIYTGVA